MAPPAVAVVAASVTVPSGPVVEEVYASGHPVVVVTVPLAGAPPSEIVNNGDDMPEVGLLGESCLLVMFNGHREEIPLPRPVVDSGPLASVKLRRRRGELVVRLPAADVAGYRAACVDVDGDMSQGWSSGENGNARAASAGSSASQGEGGTLTFAQLVAWRTVNVAERQLCEGRLLESESVRRNLFWVRGLVTNEEIGHLVASAVEASEADWDTTGPDSVDGLPVFETYLWQDGKPRGSSSGQAAGLVEKLGRRLEAYVRERYGCPSAAACHALLRRYLPEERRVHPPHFDAHAFVTAVVAVNPDDYEGGLYVQRSPRLATRRFPKLEVGDVLFHSYDLLHGVDTTSGTRFSLIFWFKDSFEACAANTSPWYRDAAAAGDDAAQYNLGTNFEYGRWGCQRNLEVAEKWYGRSAAQDNFMAINALGAMRERQQPLDGEETAVALFERAAALGSSRAMLNLARLCAHGHAGVVRDEERAAWWLRAAVAEGDLEALCLLGKAHLRGIGVASDPAEAASLFQRAAERGLPEGQLRYAAALAQGWPGRTPDFQEAAVWYRRAKLQGSAKAAESLRLLEAHGLAT